MSSNNRGNRSNWPTVGDLHVSIRNKFTSWGLGSSGLKTVASENPDLMAKPAFKKNMNALVDIENQRTRSTSINSMGDALAKGATPIRRGAVHFVMTHAAIGRYGYSEMFHNRTGYGKDVHDVFQDIVSGPSGQG